jgi:hypothetical protein
MSMMLSQAIIEVQHKLPLWDNVVQTLPRKVLHPFSRLTKQFLFTLGETNDGSPNFVSPSFREILMEELLLHLSPRSDCVGFQ